MPISPAPPRRTFTRRGWRAVVLLALCALPAGCAEDTILPVDFNCGDGIIAGPEECDTAGSPGCVECRLTPGWECTDAECHTVCGDGLVAGDEQCDDEDRTACDSHCQSGVRATSCDMTGWWAARQTDFSIAVGRVQTSSNWHLYRFSQVGEALQVEEHINCGIVVTGTVNVNLSPSGTLGLMHINRQDSGSLQGARQGVSRETPAGCEFELERWYWVRGGVEALLPPDFRAQPSLDELLVSQPLPSETDPAAPTGANIDGHLDIDEDGLPGLSWFVSGNARGTRGSVQRDWAEYRSTPEYPIDKGVIEFTTRNFFDSSESFLVLDDCPLLGCGILSAGSTPSPTLNHRVTFQWLGASLDEPRVASVVQGPLRVDDATDVATCERVRTVLPHLDVEE